MTVQALVRRYVRNLVEHAERTGTLEQWRDDLHRLAELYRQRDVRQLVANPRLQVQARVDVLTRACNGQVSAGGLELLAFLMERGETRAKLLLPHMAFRFQREADRREGIVRAQLTTAVPVSEQFSGRVRRVLARESQQVILEERVDPAILGGFVLRIEDRLLDLSFRSYLAHLKEQLTQA